jgi:hypothetical protein
MIHSRALKNKCKTPDKGSDEQQQICAEVGF